LVKESRDRDHEKSGNEKLLNKIMDMEKNIENQLEY